MGRILLYGFHFALAAAILFLASFALSIAGFFAEGLFSWVFLLVQAAILFIEISVISLFIDYIASSAFPQQSLWVKKIKPMRIAVGMTAYNDEASIASAVKDFRDAESVAKVIVVDNNSTDRTAELASKAGATVVMEKAQGYGAACMRALKEARKYGTLLCLVEGDCTFSSTDLKKLTAYIENADMVVGTRTVGNLAAIDSQLTWFIKYGNLFIAKLIQLRFWNTRLSDAGCTFRIIRPEAYDKIRKKLHVRGNSFSPHMIVAALQSGLKVVEVPVSLKKRVGQSKGVGSSITKGFRAGLQMWRMVLTQ